MNDPLADRPQMSMVSDKPDAYEEDVVYIDSTLNLNLVSSHSEDTVDTKPCTCFLIPQVLIQVALLFFYSNHAQDGG